MWERNWWFAARLPVPLARVDHIRLDMPGQSACARAQSRGRLQDSLATRNVTLREEDKSLARTAQSFLKTGSSRKPLRMCCLAYIRRALT